MRTNRRTRTQRKGTWIEIFDKRAYAACALVTVLCVLPQFLYDLPGLGVSAAPLDETKQGPLPGSILIPYTGDICHQRMIDNASGQIRGDRLVNCDDAAAQNAHAWGQIMSEIKVTAIRKSFEHE